MQDQCEKGGYMNKSCKRAALTKLVMAVGLITFSTLPLKAENETQEIYRLYSVYSGEHFYTASSAERDALNAIGWVYEGVGWVAPAESQSPVYRLYNSYAGDHHYTVSAEERDALVACGWADEGIAFYSDEAETLAVHRQYNPYTQTAGAHNYTISTVERDFLISAGWSDENVGWYASAEGWTRPEAQAEILSIQKQMEEEAAAAAAQLAQEKASGVKGTDIVAAARKFIGKARYRRGGTSPAGFDCSGFTQYIFKQFGIKINRVAKSQASNGYKVSNPKPGDLAIWTGHAAIYAGNNTMVDATSSHHGVDERVFATWRGGGTFMGFYHIPGVDNGN